MQRSIVLCNVRAARMLLHAGANNATKVNADKRAWSINFADGIIMDVCYMKSVSIAHPAEKDDVMERLCR